jgi:hypothetical protein
VACCGCYTRERAVSEAGGSGSGPGHEHTGG